MDNPNPALITDAMWWLWEQLHALEPTSQLGGIYANKSGYHNTRAANDANWSGNYSARDAEDRGGPADKAAALDWTFPEAQHGDCARIMRYTQRLMASALDKGDPRLDGWREFYGNTNGDGYVDGYDTRYLRPASSDSSHLWHIHLSEDRDKVGSLFNKRAMLSVLKGETVAAWRAAEEIPTPTPGPTPTPTPAPAPVFPAWPGRYLKLGMSGSDVRQVQQRLRDRGWRVGVDGSFGPETASVVRAFQRQKGLVPVDGIVGPATWRALWLAPVT